MDCVAEPEPELGRGRILRAAIRIADAEGIDALDGRRLRALKRAGFSDARLAQLTGTNEAAIRALRRAHKVRPVYKRVDTCAAEFATNTAYMYSTY